MEKNPAVSVIVPVYNVEIYIRQCVDSILNQTFQDFEIILVDDVSPDDSIALCQKFYGDNDKVKIVHHEKNLGLGPARNTGIKHAVGKYVYFVDSDDFILPDALEKFYNTAEKFNAQVVHAAAWYELEQDEVSSVYENLRFQNDYSYRQEGFLTNNLAQRLEEMHAVFPTAWLCFCRRDFLLENHIEFLPIISEDETFSLALLRHAERYYILRHLTYVYRKRIGSIMTSKSADRFSKGIDAMITGSIYIGKLLDDLPHFDGCDQWRENILNHFILTHLNNHTIPFYRNLKLSAEVNDAAEKTLTAFFGNKEPFIKFFFDGYHILRYRLATLLQNHERLSNQMMSLFNRLEISSNKIVFVNFTGRGYGCNPKYIAEEILRQNLPFDLVWLVKDLKEPMPDKIRKVAYGSVDSIYELATAKVIVTNTKNLLPFPGKKPGQYFIMTWHGATGFKWIEKDAEDKLSPAYVRESKINSELTDLMLAGSQAYFEIMRQSFWYKGEILKCGLPRSDIFFNHTQEFVADIRKNLNVPPDNKIIMYAPTFRDNPAVLDDVYKFNAAKLTEILEEKFGSKWTLLIRLHPNVAWVNFSNDIFGDAENIINVTSYPDMQELLVVSDVLISDYSGVIYDFMILHKPVFIFAKDFDSYPKERGFKQLYFDLPFKVNRTEEELLDCIKNFDAATLEPSVRKYLETVKSFDTGHASEAVVERIKAIIVNQILSEQRGH